MSDRDEIVSVALRLGPCNSAGVLKEKLKAVGLTLGGLGDLAGCSAPASLQFCRGFKGKSAFGVVGGVYEDRSCRRPGAGFLAVLQGF